MFTRHNTVRFRRIDPLGDGLEDDIAAEQTAEAGAMSLSDVSAEDLNIFWSRVAADIKNDPNWFSFSDD